MSRDVTSGGSVNVFVNLGENIGVEQETADEVGRNSREEIRASAAALKIKAAW